MKRLISYLILSSAFGCGNASKSKNHRQPIVPIKSETSLTQEGSFKFLTELDKAEVIFPHQMTFERSVAPNGDEFYSEKIDSKQIEATNDKGELVGLKTEIFTNTCAINFDQKKVFTDKTNSGIEFKWYYLVQKESRFEIHFIYPVKDHCLIIAFFQDIEGMNFDYSKTSALSSVIQKIVRSVNY